MPLHSNSLSNERTIPPAGCWGVQPLHFYIRSGELTGFDVEVAKAIGEKLGLKVQFVESEWDSLLASIDSGRIDTVINAVSVTDERKKKYKSMTLPIRMSHFIATSL